MDETLVDLGDGIVMHIHHEYNENEGLVEYKVIFCEGETVVDRNKGYFEASADVNHVELIKERHLS